jgi:hypothetical protein
VPRISAGAPDISVTGEREEKEHADGRAN